LQILLKAIISVVLHGDRWHIDLSQSCGYYCERYEVRYCTYSISYVCSLLSSIALRFPRAIIICVMNCIAHAPRKTTQFLYIIRVMHTELRVDTAWRNEVTSTKFALRHRRISDRNKETRTHM